MRRLYLIAVTALCLAAAGMRARGEAPPKKLDLRVAELYLKTMAGAATKLGPFAGPRLTLLNLWATWCGPCREEMPALDRVNKRYKDRGFAVVGLNVDESAEVVKRFLARQKLGYTVLLSTPQKTVPSLGELEALPTSLLLDETGDVLEVLVGALEMPELQRTIEQRLSKSPAAPAKK